MSVGIRQQSLVPTAPTANKFALSKLFSGTRFRPSTTAPASHVTITPEFHDAALVAGLNSTNSEGVSRLAQAFAQKGYQDHATVANLHAAVTGSQNEAARFLAPQQATTRSFISNLAAPKLGTHEDDPMDLYNRNDATTLAKQIVGPKIQRVSMNRIADPNAPLAAAQRGAILSTLGPNASDIPGSGGLPTAAELQASGLVPAMQQRAAFQQGAPPAQDQGAAPSAEGGGGGTPEAEPQQAIPLPPGDPAQAFTDDGPAYQDSGSGGGASGGTGSGGASASDGGEGSYTYADDSDGEDEGYLEEGQPETGDVYILADGSGDDDPAYDDFDVFETPSSYAGGYGYVDPSYADPSYSFDSGNGLESDDESDFSTGGVDDGTLDFEDSESFQAFAGYGPELAIDDFESMSY